jgi:hypothetical protein
MSVPVPPLPQPEEEKEKSPFWKIVDGVLDVGQTVVDVAGMIPVVGEGADLVNAGISLLRGNVGDAALSAAAAVPFTGWAAGAVKIGKRVDDVADAAKTVGKIVKELGEEAGEKAAQEALEEVAEHGDEVADAVGKLDVDNPFDEFGNLKPNVRYKAGEFKYNYETDMQGRISNWNTDNLQLTNRDSRLPYDSKTPGKMDGDHAGHLAGDRFGGSPQLDNIVSQSKEVNLSQYKKIENQWAKAIGEGKKVSVNVNIKYDGDGLRPLGFEVEYSIGEDHFTENLLN